MKKKLVAIVLSLALVCAGAIGGTIAWLTSQDDATNTFTFGKVAITLDEPNYVGDDNALIVPGTYLDKDPTITIDAESEEAYIYASVENNLNDVSTLDIGSDWKAVSTQGNTTIYQYTGSSTTGDLQPVFTKVTTANEITNEDLAALNDTEVITINAYAHQKTSQSASNALTAFQTILGGDWTAVA